MENFFKNNAIKDSESIISRIQNLWNERIPLAAAMEARIQRLDDAGIEVRAPLAPNRNHMGTGFGGSLNGLAVLTGWGLVMALVGDAAATDIVIQESRMRYLRPVNGDFFGRCNMPERRQVDLFFKMLSQKGRARLRLNVEVCQGAEEVGEFEGAFVAIR